VAALLGFAQGPLFLVCWAFYLSLIHLGQDFLSFQWDILLVETGFVALLLAPWAHFRPRQPADEPAPPTAVIWLLRLLLFKLMFSSGLTKLTWGDPKWHDLTALEYHYWTQPIPTPLAWYANRLPLAVQTLSCALMFVVELALPFLIFAPRRPRRVALWGFLALQLLIAATGNYGFFNVLAIVLCVPLLDDRAWPAVLRRRLLGGESFQRAVAEASEGAGPRRVFATAAAGVLALLSIPPLVESFNPGSAVARPLRGLLRLSALASPFYLSNSYGLFRSMTTTRPEIAIETSADGQNWREVVFRYKPGDPSRAPRFFAPHMPRLDWQMWFAALEAEGLPPDPEATAAWLEREDVWLQRLVVALLRGERPVLDLLAPSQLDGAPPRYVRLTSWQYRFSGGGPDWWVRQRAGVLTGPFALSPFLVGTSTRPSVLAQEDELVEGQDDLDHDEDDDVPLDPKRPLVLQQVRERLHRVRDEVELAVDRELALLELVLVLETGEEAGEARQLPEHVGLLADLHPSYHLVLGEERVPDVAQEVAVLRRRAPAPLEALGERLHGVEDRGEARLVEAEDDALGQQVGDDLQGLDGGLVHHDLPALDPVFSRGVDAQARLLGLPLRIGLTHEARELVDERDFLERVHPEQDDRPVAEERGVLPFPGRDQQGVRGQTLGELETLEVDPLAEQDRPDGDGDAGMIERGHVRLLRAAPSGGGAAR
jgi:lipase maturation factor 1